MASLLHAASAPTGGADSVDASIKRRRVSLTRSPADTNIFKKPGSGHHSSSGQVKMKQSAAARATTPLLLRLLQPATDLSAAFDSAEMAAPAAADAPAAGAPTGDAPSTAAPPVQAAYAPLQSPAAYNMLPSNAPGSDPAGGHVFERSVGKTPEGLRPRGARPIEQRRHEAELLKGVLLNPAGYALPEAKAVAEDTAAAPPSTRAARKAARKARLAGEKPKKPEPEKQVSHLV